MRRMPGALREALAPRKDEEAVEVSAAAIDAIEYQLRREDRLDEALGWVASERLGGELTEISEGPPDEGPPSAPGSG